MHGKEQALAYIKQILFVLLISILSVVSLELGNNNGEILDVKYAYLNIGTIFFFLMFVFELTKKIPICFLIVCMIMPVTAIVNYYVIMYRGVPFSISDIANTGTAISVLQGYTFPVTKEIQQIVLIVLCIIIATVFFHKKIKSYIFSWKITAKKMIILFFCATAFFYTGYFSDYAIKPKQTLGWSWQESYHQYGYLASTIELFCNSLNPIEMPEQYEETSLNSISSETEITNQNYPDIILILNESYYDLNLVMDITTDVSYKTCRDSLSNIVEGYVVVPDSGGGTNRSEYELLSSNSLQLASRITPFNVLDLTNANSIVSILRALGYDTSGAHSEPALNYSRGKGYRALGFDRVFFDGDFENLEYYEERWFETDTCLYKNMIQMYNQMEPDSPRFFYLLTIQNHGGWDMNAPEFDYVHVKEDFGNYTEQINEFLSCMYLSDLALRDLIAYYETVDRPVIICMVGDHSPIFVNDLVQNDTMEINMKLHSTPFVIWANYPIEGKNLGYIGMNALVPNLLQIAGVPLSSYYQYILDLQEQVPVLTAYGVYMDQDGAFHRYEEDTEYTEAINRYFNLEYNNIGKYANRIQSLFEP